MLFMACGRSASLQTPAVAPEEGAASAEMGMATQPEAPPNAIAKLASLEAADVTGASSNSDPVSAPGSTPGGPEAPAEDGTESAAATTDVTPSALSTAQRTAVARPARVMMDIEAKLAIEVKDVAMSLDELRSMVAAAGGQVLEESLEEAKRESPNARLTARVPSAGAFDFLAHLGGLGVVRTRQINSRDVGKQYFDASLRVRNLEQVLDRYRDLLNKADSIDETLRVEAQIARISGEIESIKGELRWLKDRVARATIRVEIYAKGVWIEPVVTPVAKLYPGLRAVGSWDWRGGAGNRYGVGLGVSLRFTRHFSIDFDGLQDTKSTGGDLEASMLTVGGEFYSDFLGAGRRQWLNPYLGIRGGYGRFDGNDQLIVGGAMGLEIFKFDAATSNLDLRALGAIGGDLGSHLILLPALGVNVAF